MKKWAQEIIVTLLGIALIGLFFFAIWVVWTWLHSTPDPVPTSIKKQINFSVIYPANYKIDPASWKYSSNQGNLNFNAKKDNYTVIFTEQQVPLAFQSDEAAYNRFIGSLKPTANFKVSLGTVSLANFVTANDYQQEGETGILNTKGTFILTHPDHSLSENQWRDLFSSLKVSK